MRMSSGSDSIASLSAVSLSRLAFEGKLELSSSLLKKSYSSLPSLLILVVRNFL